MLLDLLALVLTATLASLAVAAVANTLLLPRLRITGALRTSNVRSTPLVSVLIPLRDEAERVRALVSQLRAQVYKPYAVFLLDDDSHDGTPAVIEQARGVDKRIRLRSPEPRPNRWSGHAWACHELVREAPGQLLVFSTADVGWTPGAMTAITDCMYETDADLLIVWPTPDRGSGAARLARALESLSRRVALPPVLASRLPGFGLSRYHSACMAVRRDALDAAGGLSDPNAGLTVLAELADRVSDAGLGVRVADADGLLTWQPAADWSSARHETARHFLARNGGSAGRAVLGLLLLATVLLAPLAWLAGGLLAPDLLGWPAWPLLLTALELALLGLAARRAGHKATEALRAPLVALAALAVAGQVAVWRLRGDGVPWKGRVVAMPWGAPASPSADDPSEISGRPSPTTDGSGGITPPSGVSYQSSEASRGR